MESRLLWGQFWSLKTCTLTLIFVNSPLWNLFWVCSCCLELYHLKLKAMEYHTKGQHILMPGCWACYWGWGCWETIAKGRYLVQCAVGCSILHIALLEVSRTGTAVHSILEKIRISPSGQCFILPSRTVKCWIWLWTFLFSHIAFPYLLGFGWVFWKDQSVFYVRYSTHYPAFCPYCILGMILFVFLLKFSDGVS